MLKSSEWSLNSKIYIFVWTRFARLSVALKFTLSLFISGERQEVEGEAVAVDGEPEQPPNLGGDPSPARTTAKMMKEERK